MKKDGMKGNLTSLSELPKSQGIDVIEKLHELRRRNYSADRMTLAAQAKDTLDNLEALVRRIFSQLPVRYKLDYTGCSRSE
ncbi:unnamed protein product [Protopolystoma xenopodis]|uniref:Peptidase M16 C-terminal domain-containing protein n=1 Tax=Protopolystoma xenopodis TaxID=117903 RepID=A0A448WU45_9PLAT|nr:unnamed protein product [Protopolystoma xenopodis]